MLRIITLLILSFNALAAQTYTTTEVYDNAIWLGSNTQAYRQGLVIKLEVPMNAGETAIVLGEGEGSIYRYPWNGTFYTFPMFVSSALYAFPSYADVPAIYPRGDIPDSVLVSSRIGMDIWYRYNYYSPQNKSGVFVAPSDDTYTFAMYWWGGSSMAGNGNAVCVYPGTSRLSVVIVQ